VCMRAIAGGAPVPAPNGDEDTRGSMDFLAVRQLSMCGEMLTLRPQHTH